MFAGDMQQSDAIKHVSNDGEDLDVSIDMSFDQKNGEETQRDNQ